MPVNNFRKAERIRNSKSFSGAREAGRSVRSGPFKLSVLETGKKRLGIVVPKRLGKAAERNRLRRVIREFFRLNKGEFLGGDYVVVAKDGSMALSNQEVRERVSDAVQRVK